MKEEVPNKLFRARFSVEALASQSASETIQILDPSTGTMRLLKEDSVIKRGEVFAIAFKAFVKERESDYHYYQISIVSTDLDSFFSHKIIPTEYLAKESVREEVEDYLNILLSKKVWVEAGIKKVVSESLEQLQIVHT